MSELILHPTRGVNPHLLMCERCGEEYGVVLIGIRDSIYRCDRCDAESLGYPPRGCPRCHGHVSLARQVADGEKFAMGRCKRCEDEEAAFAAIVAEGGVYWRCADCGGQGVLRAEAKLASLVREQADIKAPHPVGIEFTKQHGCPACNTEQPAPSA